MEKRHRIFVAINLPEEVKKELFAYSEKWPELPAKWTAKDNLHITLEFLGDLTDVEIGEVCVIVKKVAERHSCFSLNINQILYGPPNPPPDPKGTPATAGQGKIPRMVWAEGQKSKELQDLKNDLEESLLEKIKFRPGGRGFVPHITLARISEWEFRKFDLEDRPEINENIDLFFTVESIEVMGSELKRSGPVYTILESHNLK